MSVATAGPAGAWPASREREQLGLELLVFFCLSAFVAARYASLIASPPTGRVLLVAGCVTLGCGLLAASGGLERTGPPITALRIVLVGGTFATSMLLLRIPAHLLAPEQWSHLADRLAGGLDELGWLWPYRGGDRWAQTAVLVPIPAVLLAAGAACFWPARARVGTRRVLALTALLAVFVTGTANASAPLPAFDGAVLAGLVAATLLLPLTPGSETGRALCWLAVCGAAALSVQSLLGSASPWIHYRDSVAAAQASATFEWDQLYGPDRWPYTQAPMIAVFEPRPELLRVSSLDRFDGLRFLRSAAPPGVRRFDLPHAGLRRWTRRASIEIEGLRSPMLASGGGVPTGARWLDDLAPALAWRPDRTLTAAAAPARGATYLISSYDPRPSAARARRAPRSFPRQYLPYTQFALPAPGATALARPDLGVEARRTPAASRLVGPSAPGRTLASSPRTAALIEASPYARMFALARRLAAGAPSSYDVAARVARYLRRTYSYDRRVALTRYPLEAFLFSQRRGYCQQFSGAMTLLLRMDGVPARVGVGFRPVARGARGGAWSVRASDAHAWAEVFLGGIGWVAFDPTPPTALPAPASESTALSRSTVFGGRSEAHGHGALPRLAGRHVGSPTGGPALWPLALLAIGLVGLLAVGSWAGVRGWTRRRAREGDAAATVAELERALEALGRAEPGLTLARLERDLERDGYPEAAGYVRDLRARRFGSRASAEPSAKGRSQLRRALAASRGVAGWVRAVRALPPAWGFS